MLTDHKRLFKHHEVRIVSVPKYDELSVKALVPKLEGDKEFFSYIPDSNMAIGR